MKLGIVGLPNVGKSTLFNAITNAGAECANYPFCTIEPNVSIVPVPDERLVALSNLYNSKKTTPAVVEFVDIAGLVKGASRGEGLGNKFLSHIREVDAIVHVVRCYKDEKIVHTEEGINPQRDIDIIEQELILSDLETIEKRKQRAEKLARANDIKAKEELELIEKVNNHLLQQKPLRLLTLNSNERAIIDDYFLLTDKPVIFVGNISEDCIGQENEYTQAVRQYAKSTDCEAIFISCKLENELANLDENDKQEFMKELGIKEKGLDILIRSSYKLLGLISFLTAGEKETRAWTIKNGAKAPEAAGKIHTDFEKGFIKAEVANFVDIIEFGGYVKTKEKGKVRIEGKDYIVKDGDVILFKFNV